MENDKTVGVNKEVRHIFNINKVHIGICIIIYLILWLCSALFFLLSIFMGLEERPEYSTVEAFFINLFPILTIPHISISFILALCLYLDIFNKDSFIVKFLMFVGMDQKEKNVIYQMNLCSCLYYPVSLFIAPLVVAFYILFFLFFLINRTIYPIGKLILGFLFLGRYKLSNNNLDVFDMPFNLKVYQYKLDGESAFKVHIPFICDEKTDKVSIIAVFTYLFIYSFLLYNFPKTMGVITAIFIALFLILSYNLGPKFKDFIKVLSSRVCIIRNIQ